MGFHDEIAAVTRAALSSKLGDPVTYTPSVGSAVDVSGFFDETYTQINLGEVGVSSTGPAVFLMLADLPSDPETDAGATVTFASKVYTITEARPVGAGGVLLRLHWQTP